MNLPIKIVALFLLIIIQYAAAAGKLYNQQEFESLIAQEKTVVVHIHADWCGTCKAQDVQINAAMNAEEFKDIVFLEVDYDVQRKALKFFNIKIQSTIILFRQGIETDRIAVERDPAELQAFLRKAL